jgi:predicted dehydrogenase
LSLVRFVVVGLGGYGLAHIEAVRWLQQLGLGKLTGVVALEVDRHQRPELVKSLLTDGVRLFDTFNQFLQQGVGEADVLTVPIGINMHVPVSVRAMEAGLHVYCEKPAAATVQDVDSLISTRDRTGRLVAIGFQHIWSNSIRQLKARVCDGRLGAVRALRLICGWPRSRQYYGRNEWTGRLRRNGDWILDSPANNANAHYLLNALYISCGRQAEAATPVRVQSELYRAYPIEGPDTVQIRCTTDEGADIYVAFTHANSRELGPYMELECANGKAFWQTDNGRTFVRYRGGATEEFDNLTDQHWRYEGFRDLVGAITAGGVPKCTPEVARAQTLAVNAMHESCPEIAQVPDDHVVSTEDWEMYPPNTRGNFLRIRNLDEYMRIAFEEREFFSALRVPWARQGNREQFVVRDYTHYPAHERAMADPPG